MEIKLPELSLVVLIGTSGSGKSTFARRNFLPTEIMSSDFCRGLVSDDENDQASTNDAFEVLHYLAGKRLSRARLTVVDATNVQPEARKPLVALARQYHVLPVAIVIDVPEAVCHQRNRTRPDRDFGEHVVRRQHQQLRRSIRNLEREGFRHVFVLRTQEAIDTATIRREPLWNNLKHEVGPFDIIGDVHGCYDELLDLLGTLGYEVIESQSGPCLQHPEGRKAIFVGDLVDRGPNSPAVIRLVRNSVDADKAHCVAGNHEVKLVRKLRGKNVNVSHGLEESLRQLDMETESFRKDACEFMDDLVSHYVLDGGRLVVAHAGLREEMHGRGSGAVRSFCLYGETTGENDEYGLPIRYNWAADYRGQAMVVYGHTPVPEAQWLNNTICIDTGCVFGGRLTALRYPERELISVPSRKVYYEPIRPLVASPTQRLTTQQAQDELLDLDDVLGKRIIDTEYGHPITIREENAVAALEVMSRFAANPKWLIYLPPTMSPSETHREGDFLEHPAEAFSYYQRAGVRRVVCEEKHMGSRAVVVVCRDEEVARKRFGIEGEGQGIVYTRTGRRFFNDPALDQQFVARVHQVVEQAGMYERLSSDWIILDCELMPWSAKAQDLLRNQYAAVGAAGNVLLRETANTLATAAEGDEILDGLRQRTEFRLQLIEQYISAYRRYCWSTDGLEGLRLAPFHILASEGAVHSTRDHPWHMEGVAALSEVDPALFVATPYRVVDLEDASSVAAATDWWMDLTSRGGEGMVVKPYDFIARNARGLVQPAVKCRGKEYLRIIYGPEYSLPENLDRLRSRGLAGKRSLALREFCLGLEALKRFIDREPLRRVHECTFGVLALESEPVDPRL